MDVARALADLGLTQKEILVYTALVQHGSMAAAPLAKLVRLNRATTYHVAKKLQSYGLVNEDANTKVSIFSPCDPVSIHELVERPRRALDAKEKIVAKTVEALTEMAKGRKYVVPTFQSVYAADIEDFLYSNTIKWQNSCLAVDGVWWGFQDHLFVERYAEWISWTWKTPQAKRKAYMVELVSNRSVAEGDFAGRPFAIKRRIHFSETMQFGSTMWIVGEYVVMVMTQSTPFYLVEIRDKHLAQNMRAMFREAIY